jgi:cytidine deaminase
MSKRKSSIKSRTAIGDSRESLIEAARVAAESAYAPYSKFKVGAALLTTRGDIVPGCNVENASYGMTNCAERTAIFSAVAQLGPNMEIQAIVVVNDGNAPCSPCGACRQVIYEFGPKATVFFLSTNGWEELPITDLLPYGFRLK